MGGVLPVIRRDEEQFEVVILKALPESPSERILALLEACVPDYDWTFWIELWSLSLRDERASALRAELDERFRDLIEEIVRDGVEAGEFSVPDTRSTAITISTLIDAMALQATLGDTTIRPNYLLDACVTVCGTLLGAPLKLPPSLSRTVAEPILPRVGWGDVVGAAAQLIPERGIAKLTLSDIAEALEADEAAVPTGSRTPARSWLRLPRSATTGSSTRPGRGWPTTTRRRRGCGISSS